MKGNMLEVRGLSKSYNGQKVLDNVNISIKPGEVNGIIGENGAGKSTLMKILAGVEKKDSGEVYVKSQKVEINSPSDAHALGIWMIFQDIKLIPSLSVVENIYLGNWIYCGLKWFPIINWKRQIREAKKIFDFLGVDINPNMQVCKLGLAQQRMVEIAKALCFNGRILILDETTAGLNDRDTESLFRVIKRSKEMGASIFFVSHKINDVIKITDTITIMRDGKIVESSCTSKTDLRLVIGQMAGKQMVHRYPKIKVPVGKEIMKLDKVSDNSLLEDVSLELREGEILGLTGLMGSGRTAVAKTIFGLNGMSSGKIYIDAKEACIKSPMDAINKKIAFVPENKSGGLVQTLSIAENISLSNLKSVVTKSVIDISVEKQLAQDYIRRLGIKSNKGVREKIEHLSDGNQQKVMIAKWLLTRSKIFIFDEPTKGLDAASKVEVYNLINEMILKRSGVLLISSDIAELVGMSDRVLILYKGKIVKELKGGDINEANIMYYASGGS